MKLGVDSLAMSSEGPCSAAVGGALPVSKSNLLGYWPLGEASGTRLDSHTTAKHLSLLNGSRNSPNAVGINGSCYNPSNYDDRYGLANTTTSYFNATGDLTVSAWLRPSTVVGDTDSADPFTGAVSEGRCIAQCTSSNDGTQYDWDLSLNSSGQVMASYWAATGIQATGRKTSTTALVKEVWTHVLMTIESGVIKIYINGAEETLTTDSTVSFNNSFNYLRVRMHSISGDVNTGCFLGRMDEMAVWSRAVAAGEITTLYNDGTGTFFADFEDA